MITTKGKPAKAAYRISEEKFKLISEKLNMNDSSLKIAFLHFVEGKTVPEIAKAEGVDLSRARIYAILRRVREAAEEQENFLVKAAEMELPSVLHQFLKHLQTASETNIKNPDYIEGLEYGLKCRLAGRTIEFREQKSEADRLYNEGLKMVIQLGKLLYD